MMQNNLRQIKVVLYKLKRNFGLSATLYKPVATTPNYRTGSNTATFTSLTINKVIALPETLKREFVSLNGALPYGGYFDAGSRVFIIDSKDLTSAFVPDINYYLVFKSRHYDIKEVHVLENGAGYVLVTTELKSKSNE